MNRISAHRRVAIIQARMSSSRLPGKVLAPLLGLPMIVFMARRVKCARLVDEVVVATSTDSSDDPLASSLSEHGIPCVRGNLQDVLDRFRTAARLFAATQVVRLTGDCPLMDAELVDRALTLLTDSDAHYVSNISPPTYPDGLDVEAFTIATLENAWRHAKLPSEREHVTLFMRAGHDHIRTLGWSALADLSSLRWTVDHADDLDHVRRLLEIAAIKSETAFDRFDLYRIIEREHLGSGAKHLRNEGLEASLAKDPGTVID
jgi:spore coat polysaccharide biosynthesis protein SpsF